MVPLTALSRGGGLGSHLLLYQEGEVCGPINCFIKRRRLVVPLTGLSRGEVWGHINCFIKRRFVVPLTALSRGRGLWSH